MQLKVTWVHRQIDKDIIVAVLLDVLVYKRLYCDPARWVVLNKLIFDHQFINR